MLRKYLLPLLAIAGFVLAFMAAAEARRPVHSQPSVVEPAINPYSRGVSGAGIIEAASENIAVAPPIGGIVDEVAVKWGQSVQAGDPLYRMDARPTQSQLAVQKADVISKEAALTRARADLDRLKSSPRDEDKPIYQAKVDAARAQLSDAEDQYQRMNKMKSAQVVSEDELNKRYWAAQLAKAQLQQAQADFDKLIAGTWSKDITVQEAIVAAASADLAAANAKLKPLEVDLDRLIVRAPVAGIVLRVNARKGEYVAAAGVGSASDGAVVIGDTEHLNVRVDIDENDIPRFVSGAPAVGFVRGATKRPLNLKFIRVEPFIIPKKNLTGGNTERVDTRVLQVIYTIHPGERKDFPLFVGQQVDVYIDAPTAATATTTPAN